MKRLTLLRHAKSSWNDARQTDHDRPLSGRGERDAPRIGARLRARKARPTLILTSPAKRAIETAKIIANALDYPREFLQAESNLYHADAVSLLEIVAAQEDHFSDLMVVAHNPGLTMLTNRLLPDFGLDNLPTSGVIAIDFDTDQWSNLARLGGKLAYYDYPKNPQVILDST